LILRAPPSFGTLLFSVIALVAGLVAALPLASRQPA
jgi:hypothetical protein